MKEKTKVSQCHNDKLSFICKNKWVTDTNDEYKENWCDIIDWLDDNKIPCSKKLDEHSMTFIKDNIIMDFTISFQYEADAMRFKLRWMGINA